MIRVFDSPGAMPDALMQWCTDALTLGSRGRMQYDALDMAKADYPALVIVYTVDLGAGSHLPAVGWLLVDYHDHATVFVLPEFRRLGIATALLMEAGRRLGYVPPVYKWNDFIGEARHKAILKLTHPNAILIRLETER